MKKLSYLILITLVSTGLFACGGSGDNNSDDSSTTLDELLSGSSNNNSGDAGTTLDESFNGSLSSSDQELDGVYYDSYSLPNVVEGQTIYFSVSPNGFDAYIILLSEEEVIDIADSGFEDSTESLSTIAPNSGDYFIVVSSYEAGETGTYTLDYQVSTDGSVNNDDSADSEDSDSENSDSDSSSTSGSSSSDSGCHHSSSCGMNEYFSYSQCSCVGSVIY